MGDCIARLVPFLYFEHFYPTIQFHVWVPSFFVEFAKRCVGKNVLVRDMADIKKKLKTEYRTYNFNSHRVNNLSTHFTVEAFSKFNAYIPDPNWHNYPKARLDDVRIDKYNLPEKYFVICPGSTSPVRELLPEHINKINDYCINRGFTPVFLGRSASDNGAGFVIAPKFREEVDYTKGINLIDKTSLVETVKIIQKAQFIVGLDNGLLHMAACTDIPIVCGFTTVYSEHRLPYRNGIMGYDCYPVELNEQELKCRGCQSKFIFLFTGKDGKPHDFKTCYEGTKKCLELLNSDRYIKAIEQLIKDKGI